MAARLTLVGKPDCHLCHEMRAVVERVLAERPRALTLVERDVRDDPEWARRYLVEIPVLLLNGIEVVRHRVTEAALLERLAAMGVA